MAAYNVTPFEPASSSQALSVVSFNNNEKKSYRNEMPGISKLSKSGAMLKMAKTNNKFRGTRTSSLSGSAQ